jgi:hypothetical protein
MRRLLTVIALLCLSVSASWGQQAAAPARFTFRMGAGYDQGDFGAAEISRAYYVPFSLRYTASRFDIGVSSAFARIDTAGGIRLIDGVPTQTDSSSGPLQESGIGDTTVRSRFFVLNDQGRGTAKPSVTPFVKIKIPTADETRGLGTGKVDYGFGVELDKEIGPIFLFGDVAYTVMGKIPELGFRNRPAASVGVGKQVTENVTVSSMVDWRRAVIAGNTNPTELVGVLSYRVTPRVSISPNAFKGLSQGSADYGVGVQMSFKF